MRRSELESDVSAVMSGMEGRDVEEEEEEAHFRVWANLVELRPAKARVLRGEFGVLTNLRASLTTYLPVKPDAPKMIMSYVIGCCSSAICEIDCNGLDLEGEEIYVAHWLLYCILLLHRLYIYVAFLWFST